MRPSRLHGLWSSAAGLAGRLGLAPASARAAAALAQVEAALAPSADPSNPADRAHRARALDRLAALARRDRDALPARLLLARHATALTDDEFTHLARAHPGLLESAVSAASASPDPLDRRTALRLIRDRLLLGQAERAATLLVDADDAVAAEADRTLVTLVEHALATISREGDPRSAEPAARATLEAVRGIDRHRRAALADGLAHLAAADVPAARRLALVDWLADRDHPGSLALRRRLRRDGSAHAFAAAWVWLNVPALATAAADRLLAGVNPTSVANPRAEAAAQQAVLLRAHRVANPARARALAAAAARTRPDLAGALPDPDALAAMPPAARQGYSRLLARWPAALRDLDAALAPLLADPDPAVRLVAIRSALARGGRPACLLDFAFDPHERLARTAAMGVLAQPERPLTRDPLRERVVAALARSRDRRTAALATGRPALATPAASPALTPAFALAEPEHAEQIVRALRRHAGISRHVATLAPLLAELLPRPDAPHRRLAATLAAALGEATDPRAFEALSAGLEAGDPRVRANALDALVHRARRLPPGAGLTPTIERLADRVAGESHRLTANAARGLLLLGGSLEQDAGTRLLLGLLRDARPLPRAAGLWLAERLAPRLAHRPDIVDAVAALARAAAGREPVGRASQPAWVKPDPVGRASQPAWVEQNQPRASQPGSSSVNPDDARAALRADRTARRLLIELREDWSRRAAGVATPEPATAERAA